MRTLLLTLACASLTLAQNADNGKKLFVKNGCWQCHGYDGHGGAGAKLAPRPIPMAAFIAYIRHPGPGNMPIYTTKVLPDAEASDIWAFLKSIPDPPAVKDVPLLARADTVFENEWVRVTKDELFILQHGVYVYPAQGTADWSLAGKMVPGNIHIEIKRNDPPPPPAPDPLDSLKLSGVTQKLIFENEYVRVIDDVIPVGVTEPMHHHPRGVVVYLTPNYVTEQILPDGRTTRNTRNQNEVAWAEAFTHSVKNIGAETSHAIRVELKY